MGATRKTARSELTYLSLLSKPVPIRRNMNHSTSANGSSTCSRRQQLPKPEPAPCHWHHWLVWKQDQSPGKVLRPQSPRQLRERTQIRGFFSQWDSGGDAQALSLIHISEP